MKTQKKIKELIEKYKNLCFASDCLNDSNIYSDAIEDLETLLEPECDHLETAWKESTRVPDSDCIDQFCIDCHEYLVTAPKSL